jgi:hypothetical protein
VHQLEEATLLRTQFAIFGEVSASLTHEPHRRAILTLSPENVEQRLGQFLSFKRYLERVRCKM